MDRLGLLRHAHLARSLRHSKKAALSLCSSTSGDMSAVQDGRRGSLNLQQEMIAALTLSKQVAG